MKNLDFVGIKKSKEVIGGLHQLLADLHVYYANLRGYHWNVRGIAFYAIHQKTEELYDAVADQIDEVAERLLQLDETPENHIDKLAKKAELKAKGEPAPYEKIVEHMLEDIKYILDSVRTLADVADEAGDHVTNDLLVGYLPELEKTIWMLNAYRA